MKKIFYLLTIACVMVLGLVACSDDEETIPAFIKLSAQSDGVVVTEDGLSATTIVPAVGGMVEINVETNIEWRVELQSGSWCAFSVSDGKLQITVPENKASTERSLRIRLRSSDEADAIAASVLLSQDGASVPDLSVQLQNEDQEIVFSEEGGEYTVKVNAPEGWTVETDARWCTITEDKAANTFTISTGKNKTLTLFTGTVIVCSGSGRNEAVVQIPASQLCVGDAMILTLKVGVTTENVGALPLDKTYNGSYVNCVVDWGDGTMQHVCYSYPQHEYKVPGTYKVRIYGRVDSFYAAQLDYFGDALKNCIISIDHWGNIGLKSLKSGFYKCTALTHIAPPDEESFSQLTTAYSCFWNCSSLIEIPEGFFASAPKLTEAYEVFNSCISLTKVPDRLFAGCSKLTRTFRAFWGCTSLQTVGEDILAGCSVLKDAGQMFTGCTSLVSVPVSIFDDCPNLVTVSNLFVRCAALSGESPYTLVDGVKVHLYERSLYPDLFADISAKLTNYKSCFGGCVKLTDYPLLKMDYPDWVIE